MDSWPLPSFEPAAADATLPSFEPAAAGATVRLLLFEDMVVAPMRAADSASVEK